jgi:hypothetical protein
MSRIVDAVNAPFAPVRAYFRKHRSFGIFVGVVLLSVALPLLTRIPPNSHGVFVRIEVGRRAVSLELVAYLIVVHEREIHHEARVEVLHQLVPCTLLHRTALHIMHTDAYTHRYR